MANMVNDLEGDANCEISAGDCDKQEQQAGIEIGGSQNNTSNSQPSVNEPRKANRRRRARTISGGPNAKVKKADAEQPIKVPEWASRAGQGAGGRPTVANLSEEVAQLRSSLRGEFKLFRESLTTQMKDMLVETVRKTVQQEISKFKNTFDDKIEAIVVRVQDLEDTAASGSRLEEIEDQVSHMGLWQDGDTQRIHKLEEDVGRLKENGVKNVSDISKNIVLRNVPESPGEKVEDKVYSILRKELKLNKVKICGAERKKSFNENKNGVIIATCGTMADKTAIMKAKPALANSRQYSKVVIHSDKPKHERVLDSKLWQINKILRENNIKPFTSGAGRPGDRVSSTAENGRRDEHRPPSQRSYESQWNRSPDSRQSSWNNRRGNSGSKRSR